VGRLSPLKVTRDPAACTGCGQCTTACPARLPVHAMTRVASVECTSCQDCVAACPVKGCLAVRPPGRRGGAAAVRPAAAVAIAVAVFLAIVVAFRATGHWSTAVTEREYAARLASVGSPLYDHARGEVTASGENPSAIHAAGTQ
jgi:ferredoxin